MSSISIYLSFIGPYTRFMANTSWVTWSLITFMLLLLLCSVCISPVMASQHRETTIEDGVHLVKFDDSPTILDSQFYKLESNMDFIVDGNQFYWVRIGSVKARGLTVPWWLDFAVVFVFLFPIILTFVAWYYESRRRFPSYHAKVFAPLAGRSFVTGWAQMVVFLIPVMLVGLVSMVGVVSGFVPAVLTHAACDGFVDVTASDDTILLKVDKMHPETNELYVKSGVDLTKLTHLSSSGNILNMTGVNPT